jgi:protein subunit release factor A
MNKNRAKDENDTPDKRYQELEGLLASPEIISHKEQYNKYAKEFDIIIEPFLEYAYVGELSFQTAYGQQVTMSYNDYNEISITFF